MTGATRESATYSTRSNRPSLSVSNNVTIQAEANVVGIERSQ